MDERATPLVTVAVSTWNRAHLVGRAIGCALAQTFRDIEVLVVDDGSTDATAVVLAGLSDERLRCVRHERNQGVSRTRNTAIRLARGTWIAFLDDDNEWPPDYLERQLAVAASHPEAGVIFCRARVRNARSGSEWLKDDAVGHGTMFGNLVAGWQPMMSATLIRRSELIAVGGLDEELLASEDCDVWLSLAQRTGFAGTSDVLLTRHIEHGPQISRNADFLARDAVRLGHKWRAAITAACGRLAYRRWHTRALLRVERHRIEEAMRAMTGGRGMAARSAARLVPLLPWSAPLLAETVAFSALGERGRLVIRRGWGYWYGLRRRLGLPVRG